MGTKTQTEERKFNKYKEEEKQALVEMTKKDLLTFSMWCHKDYQPAWFHERIAEELMKIENGENKRLMIFMPPRHGKTAEANIDFSGWYMGKHPDREVVAASYNAELVQEFGFKFRELVSSQAYKDIFGDTLREDSKSKSRMITTKGGGYTAVGVGGSLTGKDAHLIIIDDPIKGRAQADSKLIRDEVWNWMASTVYTRLFKSTAIVVIQTRWHKDDLSGRLIEKMEMGGEQWTIINFPAIALEDEVYKGKIVRREGEALWPEQFPLNMLEMQKEMMGTYEFSALYQQNPITSENQEFKPEWIQTATWNEVKKLNTRRFLTVDTAISKTDTSDSTGLCLNFVDGENNWYFKSWKLRINPKQLIDTLFQLYEDWNIEKIGIEETTYLHAIRPFFEQEMRKRGKFPHVVPLKHMNTQKETRIRGLIPRYESKSIYHIETSCRDLELEMFDFPKAKHDDVLDATAYQLQISQQAFPKDGAKIRPFKQTSFA